tara:strand:- start:2946 stop:3212 length:267 start_codon:yes stop_codon:yes gene_type:complete
MDEFREKLELDEEEMYREAMTNAYLLITNKLTFDELFEYNGCYLPYNPKTDNISNSILEDLIDYFCELEEYEKCSEIKKIKDSVDNKE